jgi:adenosylhomocysteinase
LKNRIHWVRQNCRLLAAISEEFKREQPFAGLTIGTAIHLEPKTVALLLTLQDGGAKIVSTGNLNSTQSSTIAYLQQHGVTVIGDVTRDADEHWRCLGMILDHEPELLLDNGGQLFDLYRQRPYGTLLGGTEETTSGRMALEPLRDQLQVPILVINDSPIKQFAENEHAVGQSVLESYMRITNRMTNGQRVSIFGYGACGTGVAANFRNANAKVSVFDNVPVKRLRAHLHGYDTPSRDIAISTADFIVTVTGGKDIIVAADLDLLKDGAMLANAGHFPLEIDVQGLIESDKVARCVPFEDGIESLHLTDGRVVHLITHGHMINLAGPRPLGNSIESMDLGFALQARCLEAVACSAVAAESCVVPVPDNIDAQVSNAYLDICYGDH